MLTYIYSLLHLVPQTIRTVKQHNLKAVQQQQRREERVEVHVEAVRPLHVPGPGVAPQVAVAHVPGRLLKK